MSRLRNVWGATALAGALLLVSPAARGDATSDSALKLFEQGRAAYREGHFAESAALIKQAYELKPEPVLLYNLARAYEGQGELELAEEAYARYLKDEPQIDDRGNIEQKVASLRKLIDERKQLAKERDEARNKSAGPSPRPASKALPEAPDAGASISPAPWIVAGGGALICGLGGVMGGLSLAKNDDAIAATNQADALATRSDAETFAIVANVGYAVGGALAAAGLIWGIVDVTTSGPSKGSAVTLRVSPAGFELTGSY